MDTQRPSPPLVLWAASCVFVAAGLSQAGQKGVDKAEGRFWFDSRRSAAAGAAQLVGARSPLLAAAMRLYGREVLVWGEKRVPDKAPALNAAWLDSVRDDKPFLDLRPRAPDELMQPKYRDGYQEYLAYCQALVNADQLPADAFAKRAAENPDLDFGSLYREAKRLRGKVVHMTGSLKRVTKPEVPLQAEREGVKAIYEGWIYLDRPGPPVVVIFPHLPEGLKVGDYAQARRVAFDGYFFKRYRYRSGYTDKAGNWKEQTTLLFIAPTLLTARAPPTPAVGSPLPRPVLYGVIGFIALTVSLLVAVSFWYRRTDRKVRARLQELQAERFEGGLLSEDEGHPRDDSPPGNADGANRL